MPESLIYTVGHSTQTIERFTELLRRHSIDCVVDVRSTPYSRRVPHFNRESLRASLLREGIRYIHMPNEFGARRTEPDLLDEEGRVDFDRVRASDSFRAGVERLRNGVGQGFRIALMCAEANPFDCHRFTMISRPLVEDGFAVKHILRNGDLLENQALEQKLIQYGEVDLAQPELGSAAPESSLLDEAYRKRGKEIAYQVIPQT